MADLNQFLGGGGKELLLPDLNSLQKTVRNDTPHQHALYTLINLPGLLEYSTNISNQTFFSMSGKFILLLKRVYLSAGQGPYGVTHTRSASLRINVDGSDIFNKSDSVNSIANLANGAAIFDLNPGTIADNVIPISVENSLSIVGSISSTADNTYPRTATLTGQLIPLL